MYVTDTIFTVRMRNILCKSFVLNTPTFIQMYYFYNVMVLNRKKRYNKIGTITMPAVQHSITHHFPFHRRNGTF